MEKTEVKLWTLRHMRELVEANVEKLGPAMDDYDGGQQAAYEKVLTDIRMFESIIDHSVAHSDQKEPGMDY
jgi:uncharacterized protein Yka (UPF0111/DUF47 family)